MGSFLVCYCLPDCLVYHESMVAELCSQNKYELVDFCCCRYCSYCSCINNRFVAIVESSEKESGGEFEVRIAKFNYQ